DGIRADLVTGVQTCALPIYQMTQGFSPTMDGTVVSQHPYHPTASAVSADVPVMIGSTRTELTLQTDEAAFSLDETGMRKRITDRSEERRVGKEGRARWLRWW